MRGDLEDRLRGHIGRGFLTSFFVHFGIGVPFFCIAVILARRDAENRDVEMRFEEVSESELPADLPPITEEDSDVPIPMRLAQAQKEQAEQAAPEELVAPPSPEEDRKLQPAPEKLHQKIVDLDMGKDVDPPPDAKYLAQKNNRAAEETRATETNLERAQKGLEGSTAPSDKKDKQTGDDNQKIAELEDQKKQAGGGPKTAPRDPQAPGDDTPRKSLLSMRETQRRAHEVSPETADPSLPRDPEGQRSLPQQRPEAMRDLGRGKQPTRLSLTGKQYQDEFGDDAEAAQRLAEKQKSKRSGRFAERLGRLNSALENFIPEVRPGNQTALNTRAAPFAAFITEMHRTIHKQWAFGFLEDLDHKSATNAFNNQHLITRLEVVLNADGTVYRVGIVRASGYLPFDAAALDVVYSAGPYAEPPREIRSGNGKIYLHWTFHRDERACGTPGVDYYILDNASDTRDRGEAPQTGIPTPVPQSAGPKRLERRAPEEPDTEATKRAVQQNARSDDPGARAVAQTWFEAYAAGAVSKMVATAAFPFHSAGGVIAKTAADLKGMLANLVDESGGRAVRALQVYSAAGARGALGGLPSGFEMGGSTLFAVAQVSGDTFVLVLEKRSGVWKAVGLIRR